MNKPTVGSYVKILEMNKSWGRAGDIMLSDYPNPHIKINIKDLYWKVFGYHDDGRLSVAILRTDNNEPVLKGAEKITSIWFDNIVTDWEYYNPIDLTRVDLSQLDEDSLIPEDQYKIVA